MEMILCESALTCHGDEEQNVKEKTYQRSGYRIVSSTFWPLVSSIPLQCPSIHLPFADVKCKADVVIVPVPSFVINAGDHRIPGLYVLIPFSIKS